jgi:hypothetical protein
MAQVQWIYLDDSGGRHRIGLYHGDQSGHLVIHCNLRVVQIDFSVKESRTYSFFIEEDLVEVHLHANAANMPFSYEFAVNKTVDTPLNRLRKDAANRDRRQLWIGVGVLVVFLGLSLLGGRWLTQQKSKAVPDEDAALARRLAYEGVSTLAEVRIVDDALRRKAMYSFKIADSSLVTDFFILPDTGQYLLPTDLVLVDGHTFYVRYLASNPKVHRLDFEAPGRNTIADYIRWAMKAELAAHPASSPDRALCTIQTAIDQQGWRVLPDFIFQQTPATHNPRHHQDTYLRLIRNPELVQSLKTRCWDK